jgi:hypothetical protein
LGSFTLQGELLLPVESPLGRFPAFHV